MDKFQYSAASHSGIGVSADTITGFNAGTSTTAVDQIQLVGLVQGGHMDFLGSGAFTAAGHTQVRAVAGNVYGSGLTTSDAVLLIDLNGDGTTDMEIKLLGTKAGNLDAGDLFTG